MSEQGLLTRKEAAALVGRTEGAVDFWVKQGHVKKVYIDNRPFYDRPSLEAHAAVAAASPRNRKGVGHKKKTRKGGAMVHIEENIITIERLLADNRRLLITYRREAKEEVKAEVAAKLKGVLA